MRAELNMFWTWNSIRECMIYEKWFAHFSASKFTERMKVSLTYIYTHFFVCACFFLLLFEHTFFSTLIVSRYKCVDVNACWLFCSVNLHIIVHFLSVSCNTLAQTEKKTAREKEIVNEVSAKKSLWIAFFHICKWNQNNDVMHAQILQIQNLHKNTLSWNECWYRKCSIGFGMACL